MGIRRYLIKITGVVQGVGFRPFIYTLAQSLHLKGWVNNVSEGVVIDIEGARETLDTFIERIKNGAPPLSRIKGISMEELPCKGYDGFIIEKSISSEQRNIYISPDVSICEDCNRELFDPGNRRYLYPFINCTNCGPRFTIIKNVPYDRISTTMAKFPMCDRCASEYTDPSNRRYHAQPVSCYDCGPTLELTDRDGNREHVTDIIGQTRKLLKEGCIVAVKGLGGYHLVCNAKDEQAVRNLRKRKARDDKPFALMVKDVDTALLYCDVNEAEKKLLKSVEKPIILLRKRKDHALPEEIAPGNPYLGIMLPYTPVHMLLLHNIGESSRSCEKGADEKNLDMLIVTSGNRSNEPIYYKDDEAMENLKDIADFFLINDRDIYIRTDDSVTRVFRDKEYIIRRSRGYVPMPVTCHAIETLTSGREVPSVLACGGELKSTFCVNKGCEFFVSHHIGDLENAETLASFEEGIEHFRKMFNISCNVVAYDLHPEYLSSKYAMELKDVEKIAVQHHHAHIASCMAENGLNEDVIGVAFDGTGYGEDGHIWGGEFFTGGYKGFSRAGHLDYVRMPGGELAVKEPWRMAVSYLYHWDKNIGDKLAEKEGIEYGGLNILPGIDKGKLATILQMLDKGLNSPLTSSMGRLFDAVSALLGIRDRINYEGQAAIELEYNTIEDRNGGYEFEFIAEGQAFKVCMNNTINSIIKDLQAGVPKEVIASRFHETIANVVLEACIRISKYTGLNKVVLSGGVFQNMILLDKCVTKLEGRGFNVYLHSRVPSNDGGIALGQAVMAIARVSRGRGY